MRDILLFLIIFGSVPMILARPWMGIIMWSWISYMNPHRMIPWGMMYEMPVAMIIGIATLVGWVLCKEDRRLDGNAITVLMILLIAWVGITTLFALEPDIASRKLNQFFKTILMTLVAITLIKTEKRFEYFIWAAVLSIGFFSVKGGIFTILHGGQFKVWGPPDTNIMDNNALAMGTLMIVPMMVYIAQTAENRWVRWGMYFGAASSMASVIGSYSRGAFVGMAAVAIAMWWQAGKKNKLVLGTLATLAVVVGVAMLPQKWLDRMNTIQNYEQDGSATGRLEIWGHSLRIANDRPLVGGGFGVFENEKAYLRLSPEMVDRRNVHSIYFEMLGTQGYIGLILFVGLGLAGLLTAGKIMRRTAGVPELEREHKFAQMVHLSLVAYAVSGAFLNLSTWDLYYSLLAMIAMQKYLLEKKLAAGTEAAPAAVRTQDSGSPVAGPALPRNVPGRSFLRQPNNSL